MTELTNPVRVNTAKENLTELVMTGNSKGAPMVDTAFYAYLVQHEAELTSRFMDVLPEYLATIGFNKGDHFLDHDAIESLRFIHQEYWRRRLPQPAWLTQ